MTITVDNIPDWTTADQVLLDVANTLKTLSYETEGMVIEDIDGKKAKGQLVTVTISAE